MPDTCGLYYLQLFMFNFAHIMPYQTIKEEREAEGKKRFFHDYAQVNYELGMDQSAKQTEFIAAVNKWQLHPQPNNVVLPIPLTVGTSRQRLRPCHPIITMTFIVPHFQFRKTIVVSFNHAQHLIHKRLCL